MGYYMRNHRTVVEYVKIATTCQWDESEQNAPTVDGFLNLRKHRAHEKAATAWIIFFRTWFGWQPCMRVRAEFRLEGNAEPPHEGT